MNKFVKRESYVQNYYFRLFDLIFLFLLEKAKRRWIGLIRHIYYGMVENIPIQKRLLNISAMLLTLQPYDAIAYNNRGLAYADLGEYQSARGLQSGNSSKT